jgi:hypothetical protein
MRQKKKENIRGERFEIGDEVIGDEHTRGTVIGTTDVSQGFGRVANTVRAYVVKSEKKERLMYAGELNLQILKKGAGDAAPPRPELLQELENDLKYRPLSGIRF